MKYPAIDGANHMIRKEFFEGGIRPTVGMLLITRDARGQQDGLIVVRPLRDITFMPPQGGIELGETPRAAVRRECAEEFSGLKIDVTRISRTPLCQGMNRLPPERLEAAKCRAKYMVYLAVPVICRPTAVNPEENAEMKFIFDPHAFFSTISCCRSSKEGLICRAVDAAVQQGYLNWDAGIVRRHLNNISSAAA